MSFDPKTGGPERMTPAHERQISEALHHQNAIQWEKIARGEVPDYYPDRPLPNRRRRHHNYVRV
jgi:hypothetical protein